MASSRERLFSIAGVAIALIYLACGVSVMVFVASIAERGVYSLFGWHYPFEAIGHFLRLTTPYQNKVLSWDKSFLPLGIAAVLGTLAGVLSDCLEWVNKSAEQRRIEKQAALDKLQADKDGQRERAAVRRARRKPMSGWRRLWIVLSVVLGGISFAIALDAYSRASAVVPYHGNGDTAFWQRAQESPSLRDCEAATMKAEFETGDGWWVSCQNGDPYTPAFLWAIVPAVFMAAVGLTLRWIYKGFRQPTKSGPTEGPPKAA